MEALQHIQLTFKCPKTLAELTPCNNDWYCKGCHKVIRDFRGMAEADIIGSIDFSNKMHCGIFDADRITSIPQPKWQRWFSATLMALGLTALNNVVLAQHKKLQAKPATGITKPIVDTAKEQATIGIVFVPMEIQPEYPGGITKFEEFITKNLDLKGLSISESKRGLVQFTVEKDGSIADIKVVKNISPEIDEKIVQLIKKSFRWRPGIQNGRPAKVAFTIPIAIDPAPESK
ncbi:energy transducer TonB [Mucilaginibacter flavus]|uniref:energy transducer TonB n=1 Tax=Mucilaginibacter flavus TaxID=931504 RepID=UPI0025B4274C|nr:energy transducer TonB [Mucilaginibacter flavus]MDN3579452.1 energy transducer TonB [Mucilaginibacter flavus]